MANRGSDADLLVHRKAQLVAEGAAYRFEIRAAAKSVTDDLHLGQLIKSVLGHVAVAAYAAFKSRTESSGAKLKTLLPLVIGGVSALSKRSLLKPVLRAALLLGVGATVWLAKNKRNTRTR